METADACADPRELAFAAVTAAFGSLGRVCMALDAGFTVRYVSPRLDELLGPGAAAEMRGRPAEAVLGRELFGPDGPMRQALVAGERREGWRALLRDDAGGSRLLSVTAAPLVHDAHGVCDPGAAYIVVMRPADEERVAAGGPITGLGVISRSQAMARVFRLVETLQHSEATVLVTGESGTGKEVMARLIHAHSPRRKGPFVAVNVAALPGDLLESELFGHVRGAFTGAVRDRAGRFEAAADGTLFLDEVGDLPVHLQVKLLRVLQEHVYERVGDDQPRRTNARVLAATNRDLKRLVAAGAFREDLYYRLRVFPIELPPLRQRREDIEPIARLLLARVGARAGRALHFSPDALRALLEHDWPGNVRELENALEFAATVCRGQTLQPEDLPHEVTARAPRYEPSPRLSLVGAGEGASARPPGPPSPPQSGRRDEEAAPPAALDRAALESALALHRWSRAATARALGVSRSTLWRRMREHGLA